MMIWPDIVGQAMGPGGRSSPGCISCSSLLRPRVIVLLFLRCMQVIIRIVASNKRKSPPTETDMATMDVVGISLPPVSEKTLSM